MVLLTDAAPEFALPYADREVASLAGAALVDDFWAMTEYAAIQVLQRLT